jgi:hypothetical protein
MSKNIINIYYISVKGENKTIVDGYAPLRDIHIGEYYEYL